MKVPRTRKQTAPRNVAAKALRQGQFQPKVERDPKAYSRKPRHKEPPAPELNGADETSGRRRVAEYQLSRIDQAW